MLVEISTYPVDNWMGFLVWIVGRWSGRVQWQSAHWTLTFYGYKPTQYDLIYNGIRLNGMLNKVPTQSWCFDMPPEEVRNAIDRINQVRNDLKHVSLESLLKSFLYPDVPRVDTCIGFVYYIVYGNVNARYANHPVRFCELLDSIWQRKIG